MLVDHLYPAPNKRELANTEGQSLTVRWETEIHDAARELDRILEESERRDAEGLASCTTSEAGRYVKFLSGDP
jgi:hypothetical protein